MNSKPTGDNIELNLNGGVLIIGSLYWQDYLSRKDDDVRKEWRDVNLNTGDAILAKAPIRYGRLSGKDNIYTMVFSTSCSKNKLGTAFEVPFRDAIKSFEDIISQATAL